LPRSSIGWPAEGSIVRRIAVVGSTASGKSTFAVKLAARLALRHVELDALFWRPNWTPPDDEDFRAIVRREASADAWVMDGNYSRFLPITLERADAVVWLDLPLRTCLSRVIARTVRRARTRENLWASGNREDLRKLLGRDSLVWWVLKTHRRRRREHVARFADPGLADLRVFRFRSSAEAERWLATIQA
jgi:adenylate kinase family enzyme